MSATAAGAPTRVEVYSAAETAGIDETEGSSATRIRCSVSMAARPYVSMPMLGSVTRQISINTFILNNKYDFDAITLSDIGHCRIYY